MKERIIEAIFDGWCEGEYGNKNKDLPEANQAIVDITKRFHADTKDRIFIERVFMEVICKYEHNAFIDGFMLGYELLNGNLIGGKS